MMLSNVDFDALLRGNSIQSVEIERPRKFSEFSLKCTQVHAYFRHEISFLIKKHLNALLFKLVLKTISPKREYSSDKEDKISNMIFFKCGNYLHFTSTFIKN